MESLDTLLQAEPPPPLLPHKNTGFICWKLGISEHVVQCVFNNIEETEKWEKKQNK